MANWNKPDLDSDYTAFPGEVRALATSAVKLDPTPDTNIPTGALYYNSTTRRLQVWNGSSWNDIAIGVQLLAIFLSSVLPTTTTDRYLWAGNNGDSSAVTVPWTNVYLPDKSVINYITAGRSASGSGTMTIDVRKGTSTVHTTSLTQASPEIAESFTGIEYTASDILRVRVTQTSGDAALKYCIFGASKYA